VVSTGTLWREPGAPDWRSAAIDGARYTSAARLADELETVFARTWQLVGPIEPLRQAGDYLTGEIADESVIVAHGGADGLRAFYNVCRHRGRELVEPGSCGRARAFQCPYHAWTYGLDGRLRGLPDAAAFPDLDRERLGLVPIDLQVWQGFAFVRLVPGGEPLHAYLAPLADHLGPAFDPAVLVAANTLAVEANWKTTLEAFIETNHIASLHPRVGRGLAFADTAVAHFERHSMAAIPIAGRVDWADRCRRPWREWAADPDVAELHYFIFPNLSVHLFMGLTFLLRYVPDRRDPERTRLDVWIWKRVAPGETPPAPMSMPNAFGQIIEQDRDNVVRVQRGVRSRAFDGPRLNLYESRIGHFHAVLDQQLQQRSSA
jgi:phenylpropionate dioxygenase-like ring-hydroxylating dioxygenase large terminal subunit